MRPANGSPGQTQSTDGWQEHLMTTPCAAGILKVSSILNSFPYPACTSTTKGQLKRRKCPNGMRSLGDRPGPSASATGIRCYRVTQGKTFSAASCYLLATCRSKQVGRDQEASVILSQYTRLRVVCQCRQPINTQFTQFHRRLRTARGDID